MKMKDNTTKQLLEGQLETQRICSINQQECSDINPTIYNVFTDENLIQGTCDNINYQASPNTLIVNGTFVIWVKLDKLESQEKRFVFDIIDYNNNHILEIFIIKNSIIQARIYDVNGGEFALSYDNQAPLNNWTFIAFTWSEKSVNLYINKTLKGTIPFENINFGSKVNRWYIGSTFNAIHCLNGGLDELGIFKAQLDQETISYIYDTNLAGKHLLKI